MTATTLLDVDAAVAHVAAGGLVAYPTETLFGLGADARSETALARLRAWKGRDAGQPIALLVEDAAALPGLGFEVTDLAAALARDFWPGPLTLVLRCRDSFAAGIAAADGTIGVRCSPHPVAAGLARALARAGFGPVTATSLNRSGAPPAASLAAARALCEPAAPRGVRLLWSEGAPEPTGVASTVVDATGPTLRILREGALRAETLQRALAHDLALELRPEEPFA